MNRGELVTLLGRNGSGRSTTLKAISGLLAGEDGEVTDGDIDVFDRVSEETYEFENQQSEVSEEQNKLRKLLNMSVNEIELSVRAANCLNNANITSVGQLAMKSEAEMLKYRNFGKKSLNEIKEKLEALGLSLGMKFDERLLENKKEG